MGDLRERGPLWGQLLVPRKTCAAPTRIHYPLPICRDTGRALRYVRLDRRPVQKSGYHALSHNFCESL